MKTITKLFALAFSLVYLVGAPAVVRADSNNDQKLRPNTILCLERVCVLANAQDQNSGPHTPAVDTAVNLMKHEDVSVRRLSAYILGETGNIAGIEALLAGLEDKDSHVRRISARALAKINDKRAVQPLIGILGRDEARHVKITAVNTLGRLGDERAVVVLADLVQKENGSLKNEAVLVLRKLAPGDKVALAID